MEASTAPTRANREKSRHAAMTQNYMRYDHIAALNVLDGTVNTRKHASSQASGVQEFIRFYTRGPAPPDKAAHVILDNDAVHKHLKVRAWLHHNQRFTFHFTPTFTLNLCAVEV
nr:transposase [Sinorhizobium meliloti]